MGCWNESCMISNLPITCGDEIAMTVLVKSRAGMNHLRSTEYYYPAPLMFYGKYNDYGTGEDCEGVGLHYIVDEYKTCNTFDDDMTADQFVERLARYEIQLYTPDIFKARLAGDKKTHIDTQLVMIRKDVLDRILDEFYIETTFYDKDENDSFIYEHIDFQYLLDFIPDSIKRLKEFYREERKMEEATGKPSITLSFHRVPEIDYRDKNMLLKHLHHHDKDVGYDFFCNSLGEKIKSMAESNQDQYLEGFLEEYAKHVMLLLFIEHTRKIYVRPTNTSQAYDTDAHKLLAKITTEIAIENIDNKYAEEDYPDDMWDEKRKIYMEQCELDF